MKKPLPPVLLAAWLLLAPAALAQAEMADLSDIVPTIGEELPNLGFVALRGTFPDPQCPALSNSVGLAYPIGIGSKELEKALGGMARASFGRLAGAANGICPEPGEPFPSQRTAETKISFMARAPGRNYLSLLTVTYELGIGAAHGGMSSDSVTYDLRSGEPIELWDLFADPALAVPALWAFMAKGWCEQSPQGNLPSVYGLPDYQCQAGSPPLPEALKAAKTPFSALGKVLLAPEGLTIELDPYDAWSYADGPAWLDIPKDVLLGLGADKTIWD
jgi:hypothetical protein